MLGALRLDIQWVEADHLEALRIAVRRGPTTYDASHLYVDWMLDTPLLTFDEHLHSASQGRG